MWKCMPRWVNTCELPEPLRTAQLATWNLTETLAAATKHPLTREVLEQQFGRLGGTVYELRHLSCDIVGGPMIPLSVLGKLRHQMIEQLAATVPRAAIAADFSSDRVRALC